MRDAPAPQAVQIPVAAGELPGDLNIPKDATGLVIFAHGSGSSRLSPRNRQVAHGLQQAGLATLLFDLLTPAEEAEDRQSRHLRFNIALLADRLAEGFAWALRYGLPVGLFGASTGAAAALIVAAGRPGVVNAVVSRGGRPDLAGTALCRVTAPTLLLVGANDPEVLALNQRALADLAAPCKRLEVVPGAGHLFEEPGALAVVLRHTADWFRAYLGRNL